MARGDLLFTKNDLGLLLIALERDGLKEAVHAINADVLLGASPNDVLDELEEKFRIRVPTLKPLSTEIDQEAAKVEVSRDWSRHIIEGTSITFFVPFEGDPELFYCRPSSFTLNPPRADVRQGELVLGYTRLDHDAEAAKREYYADLASIQKYLESQRMQSQQYNDTLRAKLQELITERRERLLRDKGMAAALGFPMRRRTSAPKTYVAPTARRKPTVTRSAGPVKPFAPEPTLDSAEYEHILFVISNMVHVMERSPHAFQNMKEEDIRQHFLVQLNGQYEGQATGETFNFDGKTDILIRSEGKNIFIAECKFWNGPESLRNALNQLLSYASWRDTKTALLIFNRQRNFTDVLSKIPDVVQGHPAFKRQEAYKSETGFRFVLNRPDDVNRELTLTVLAFEVPA